jgi:CheY-like chemotaxis protein
LTKIFSEQLPENAQTLAAIPAVISPIAQRVPLHILVAEDHPVNQKLALQLLRKMGYRADIAANGLEVLQALERQPYDIVLMDVQMPEMDGLEATRQICQRWPREKRPRIVAMTANAMQRDREECLAAGMDDYLSKPVQLKDLQAALERSERPAITAESTAMVDDLAPVNWAILEEMRALQEQGQADFVQEMVDLYLSGTPPLLATIREAIAQGDAEGLKLAAHTLKGNSMSLGVQQVAALSLSLELSGRSQTLTGTAVVLVELEREFERARQSFVRSGNPSTRGQA